MIAIFFISTLWIPAVWFLYKQNTKLYIYSVTGYIDGIPFFLSHNINYVSKLLSYDYISVRFKYFDKFFIYTETGDNFCWPNSFLYESLPMFSSAKLSYRYKDSVQIKYANVFDSFLEFAGPNQDFFGKPFDFRWMFPCYKEYDFAELRIVDLNDFSYTIDILTNTEVNGLDNSLYEIAKIQLSVLQS